MNKIKKVILLSLCLSAFISCKQQRSDDDVTMIGLDQSGGVIKRFFNKRRFLNKFSPVIENLNDDTINHLESFNQEEDWKLKRVSVGLMLVAEYGLTENFKFEFEPSFELRFEELK